MTQSKRESIAEKWAPIIGSMSSTKKSWLEEYTNNHSILQNATMSAYDMTIGTGSIFPSMLPLAMKVAAQTIGMNIVSVKPMNPPLGSKSKEEQTRIKNEVLSENRDRKIDAINGDIPYKEMTIGEHPDMQGPKAQLLYMDFQYGGTSSVEE